MKNKFNKIEFKYKSQKKFISVIIPVYKDSEGTKDTLESLEEQNLNKSEFEIIIVNDGGDKETEKICKEHEVKIITIIPNKGSYNARNEGLKESRGEYIAFVDADIKVSENWLKLGRELLKKYDYVGGKVEIDKTKLKTLAHYFEYISAFENEKKIKKYNYIPTANLFVKRNIIKELGGFDKRLQSGGDVEFGSRVFSSRKFKMHYNDDLIVVHPPRGQERLLKKYIRVNKGANDLFTLYPNRFAQLKKSKIKFIKTFLFPLFKVITSKRKVPLFVRIQLVFWSVWFGFLRVIAIFKN